MLQRSALLSRRCTPMQGQRQKQCASCVWCFVQLSPLCFFYIRETSFPSFHGTLHAQRGLYVINAYDCKGQGLVNEEMCEGRIGTRVGSFSNHTPHPTNTPPSVLCHCTYDYFNPVRTAALEHMRGVRRCARLLRIKRRGGNKRESSLL